MIFVSFLVVAVAVVEGSGTACVRGTRHGMVRIRLMRLLCGQETGDGTAGSSGPPCMEMVMCAVTCHGECGDEVLWYELSVF